MIEVSIKEAARLLGVHVDTVRRRMQLPEGNPQHITARLEMTTNEQGKRVERYVVTLPDVQTPSPDSFLLGFQAWMASVTARLDSIEEELRRRR